MIILESLEEGILEQDVDDIFELTSEEKNSINNYLANAKENNYQKYEL